MAQVVLYRTDIVARMGYIRAVRGGEDRSGRTIMVVDDEELVSMGMRALARRRWRATSPEERKRVSADMQRAREERRRERERERELASALRERPERQAGDVAASPQAKVGEPEKDE